MNERELGLGVWEIWEQKEREEKEAVRDDNDMADAILLSVRFLHQPFCASQTEEEDNVNFTY